MCRFVVYHGHPVLIADLLYRPKHGLVEQSMKSEQSFQSYNADGFGIGFYTDGFDNPCVVRSTTPVWANTGLQELSNRIYSSHIFGHVRAASPGLEVQTTNCHPFAVDKYQFMHNGAIGNFKQVKRAIQNQMSDAVWNTLRGTTDTEHSFGLFLDNMSQFNANDSAESMSKAMQMTLGDLVGIADKPKNPLTLNFAVSDGKSTVVTRFAANAEKSPSLYYSVGQRYVFHRDDCDMLPTNEGARPGAIIVASEPITRHVGDWMEVPQNHMIVINPDGEYTIELISIT